MFSSLVWKYFHDRRHRGLLDQSSSEGWAGSTELRQFMRIQIKQVDGTIQQVRFETVGCVASIACGSFLAEWAASKSLCEALAMDAERLIRELGGLPPERSYCADMAVHALRKAIENGEEVQT